MRGRPTGQPWAHLVQPACGAETLTEMVPPAGPPSPLPAPGSSLSEGQAPSCGVPRVTPHPGYPTGPEQQPQEGAGQFPHWPPGHWQPSKRGPWL